MGLDVRAPLGQIGQHHCQASGAPGDSRGAGLERSERT